MTGRILTIRVLVIKLAIPNPCGAMSNQSSKFDVFSFQKHNSVVAIVAARAEQSVRVYNFPVRLISLKFFLEN